MREEQFHVQLFTDPGFQENGLILRCGGSSSCWIIDPGLPPEAEEMQAYIREHDLKPTAILLTHAHADHIAGIGELRQEWPELPIYLAREEWAFLSDPRQNLSAMFGDGLVVPDDNVHDLAPGDKLSLDDAHWTVLDTSGHSPGGRTLYCSSLRLAIVGDAVFAGSIGRYDFPHSDGQRLLRNIHENILTLPEDTQIVPGHGPATTVGHEKATNPYLQGDA